jgi:hypothetical protein
MTNEDWPINPLLLRIEKIAPKLQKEISKDGLGLMLLILCK